MNNFISVDDVSNIDAIVKQALAYKASPLQSNQLGKNKRIGLLFLNPSMRTRFKYPDRSAEFRNGSHRF